MPTGVRSPYSSVAESFVRFRGLPMSYTYYIYKTQEKVKSKYTMRICSLREHRLKHEWNQMVWSVNNLRCGTAVQPKLPFPHLCTAAPLTPCSLAGCLAANRRSTRPSSYLDIRRPSLDSLQLRYIKLPGSAFSTIRIGELNIPEAPPPAS